MCWCQDVYSFSATLAALASSGQWELSFSVLELMAEVGDPGFERWAAARIVAEQQRA